MDREQVRGYTVQSNVVNGRKGWKVQVETTTWEFEALTYALEDWQPESAVSLLSRNRGAMMDRLVLGLVQDDGIRWRRCLYNLEEDKQAIYKDRIFSGDVNEVLGAIEVVRRQKGCIRICFRLWQCEDSGMFYQLVEAVLDDLELSGENKLDGAAGLDESDDVELDDRPEWVPSDKTLEEWREHDVSSTWSEMEADYRVNPEDAIKPTAKMLQVACPTLRVSERRWRTIVRCIREGYL